MLRITQRLLINEFPEHAILTVNADVFSFHNNMFCLLTTQIVYHIFCSIGFELIQPNFSFSLKSWICHGMPLCLQIISTKLVACVIVLLGQKQSPQHGEISGLRTLPCIHIWGGNLSDRVNHKSALQWRHNGRLKSPASPLFTQPFIQAQTKENIKAPRHWPLCREFSGDRWIPHTNGQ